MIRKKTQQPALKAESTDSIESAELAGLRYVTDAGPGLRRQRAGKGFRYIDTQDEPIHNPQTLRRIKSLAIPPAWTDVWICPLMNGHIQASGRDAKGRKQYRYHPRWREVRDETKYNRMVAFGEALPLIRERIDKDLSQPGLSREKVVATVVRLLETTLIRVGNVEYARTNNSFGLTTMHNKHVAISGSTLRFHFRGKSGKEHEVDIHDRRLAKIVRQCQDMPGYELFQYVDETGQRQTIDSVDVNEYLREITGQDFTAKDFRTWAGTALTLLAVQECGLFETATEAKRNVAQAIKTVAQRLGNTPTVCRKHYVHPALIAAYLDGSLFDTLASLIDDRAESHPAQWQDGELGLLAFLRHGMGQESQWQKVAA